MSDSVRPHRRQPTRLPRPWDSPGKNTSGLPFPSPRVKFKLSRPASLCFTRGLPFPQPPLPILRDCKVQSIINLLLICICFFFIILPLLDIHATSWYSGFSSEITCSESSLQDQLALLVPLCWIVTVYCLHGTYYCLKLSCSFVCVLSSPTKWEPQWE